MILAPAPTAEPDLLTVGEAAQVAGVHRSTIRKWCLRGHLPSVQDGPRRVRRLQRCDLESLLSTRAAANREGAPPPSMANGHAADPPATDAAPAGRSPREPGQLLRRLPDQLTAGAALRRIAARVSAAADLDALFDEVIEQSIDLFGADAAGLWRYDGSPYPLRLASSRGLSAEVLDAVDRLPVDADTVGLRALRRRTVIVLADDLEGTLPKLRQTYRREGIRTACFVPIIFRDQPLGLLVIYHRIAYDWSDEERDLALSFADGLAAAIGTAQLYDAANGLAARLRAINDLAIRLSHIQGVGEIGEAIVNELRALIPADSVRVYRTDAETGTCEVIAFEGRFDGLSDPGPDRLRVAIGTGLTGWVAAHGQPIRLADARQDSRRVIVGRDQGPESMLVVPMGFEDRVVGVIVLSSLGDGRFSAEDETTLSIFAGFAAQALVNAQRFEQLGRQQAELEQRLGGQRRLLEINERLLSTLDPKGVLELITDSLQAVVAYDALTIYQVDRERGVRRAVVARDRFADVILGFEGPLDAGLTGWAIDHGTAVLANDAHLDPRAVRIPGTPDEPESTIVVPLIIDGVVSGTMNVARIGGTEAHFSGAEFELIQLFAGQAAIALQNAATHGAVQVRADHDALTGLRNHGAFQRELGEAIAAATAVATPAGPGAAGTRAGDRFAVLMMDLDGFKAYNDRFGHPAGDILLERIADALRDAIRDGDRLYRYGGDEFAVILPAADRTAAHEIGGRIRRAIAGLPEPPVGPRVAISVGVAVFPEDGGTNDDLVAAADHALYLAKPGARARDEIAGRRDPYLAALDATTIGLLDHHEPTALLEVIVERATALLGTPHGYIYFVEPDDEAPSGLALVLRVGTGMFVGQEGRRMSIEVGVAGAAYRTGRPIAVDDYDRWTHRSPDLPPGFGAVVGVPLTSGASVVGVIGLASGDIERTFGEREIGALGRFAQLASIALDNARLVEAARRGVLHDPITGLANRELLGERVDHALAWSEPEEPDQIAVVLLDLDRFKVINESLGHGAGDRLLAHVGARLASEVRPGDTVARFGGDEFAIVLAPVRSPEDAIAVANRISAALRTPFQMDGRDWFISASFGVAVGTPGRDLGGDLLRQAEVALVRAKAEPNRRVQLFEPAMDDLALQLVDLETDLRRAIDGGELRLHYQPIVRLDSHEIVGLEGLVRWQHPRRGLVPPASFIPLAEETGLIVPLGEWVLETAVAQAQAWRSTLGREDLILSVNLSARQFEQPDLVDDLTELLDRTGYPPDRLELEITESVVMERTDAGSRAVRRLRDLGVRLALDDFGTGYSSLAYLRHLPLDAIKIDRSFVVELDAEPGAAIVQAVIDLAHGLGIDVVAEGIETVAHAERLVEMGCDRGQGYAFARPMPASRIETLLRDLPAVTVAAVSGVRTAAAGTGTG